MTAAPALRMRAVEKRYGRNQALDGLSFEVPRGVICGLIGPNGAGKTTTFGVVGGVLRPNAGEVDLLGEGPFDPRKHAGRVTLLPQDCELNPHTTVRDLLIFYGRLQGLGRAESRREADRTLDLVGLTDRARRKIRQLSHGMRRRVSVAQALLGGPELVLLDEPTSGLDPELVVRMREVFLAQRGERTLVISSHMLAELEATCDYLVFLDRGRCTQSGPLNEITGRGSVIRVRLDGDPTPAALLPALQATTPELRARAASDELILQAPAGWDAARLNAAALPQIFAAGGKVLEVRRGQSLEETFMARRGGDASAF